VNRYIREVRWAIGKHLWPVRRNRLSYLVRRMTHRWQLIHRAESPLIGPITVWQLGRERRLVFGDNVGATTQSAVFTSGGWAELRREYWGRALQRPTQLPARPRVLLLGLGGGTIVRLLYEATKPAQVTAVELDPVVASVAQEYMGIGQLPHLDIRIGDVRQLVRALSSEEPLYDVVVEDVFFDGRGVGDVDEYMAALARLVAPGGWLVVNRWFEDWGGNTIDSGQDATCAALAPRFEVIERVRITQRWLNELIFAGRPHRELK
jgi:SAM-dependent methyltransferase